MTLRLHEARERYFARTGFSTAAYCDPRFTARLGPLVLPLPNPGLLPWHDLHHVLTGYDTDLLGEAEISAFELRAGWGSPRVLALCLACLAIGFLIAPRRMLRAWRRARGARSLYRERRAPEELLPLELCEVRRRCRIPEEGYAGSGLNQARSPARQG